jgi:hypothetical protein
VKYVMLGIERFCNITYLHNEDRLGIFGIRVVTVKKFFFWRCAIFRALGNQLRPAGPAVADPGSSVCVTTSERRRDVNLVLVLYLCRTYRRKYLSNITE